MSHRPLIRMPAFLWVVSWNRSVFFVLVTWTPWVKVIISRRNFNFTNTINWTSGRFFPPWISFHKRCPRILNARLFMTNIMATRGQSWGPRSLIWIIFGLPCLCLPLIWDVILSIILVQLWSGDTGIANTLLFWRKVAHLKNSQGFFVDFRIRTDSNGLKKLINYG